MEEHLEKMDTEENDANLEFEEEDDDENEVPPPFHSIVDQLNARMDFEDEMAEFE